MLMRISHCASNCRSISRFYSSRVSSRPGRIGASWRGPIGPSRLTNTSRAPRSFCCSSARTFWLLTTAMVLKCSVPLIETKQARYGSFPSSFALATRKALTLPICKSYQRMTKRSRPGTIGMKHGPMLSEEFERLSTRYNHNHFPFYSKVPLLRKNKEAWRPHQIGTIGLTGEHWVNASDHWLGKTSGRKQRQRLVKFPAAKKSR